MNKYGLDFIDVEDNSIAVFIFDESADEDHWKESLSMTLWDAWRLVRGQARDGDPRTDRMYDLLQAIFAPADKLLQAYAVDAEDARKALGWKGIALADGESVALGIERLYAQMQQRALVRDSGVLGQEANGG